MNISFPNDLYIFICERAYDGAYSSTSEYIRALVRDDRIRSLGKRQPVSKTPRARTANEIMAGVRSRETDS